jgi:sigma-B regulation protein RsbU (phosphoserine phosphatase)
VSTTERFRRLMREVDQLAQSLEGSDEDVPTIQRLADALTKSFGRQTGLSGGRLYVRQGDDFLLWSVFGEAAEVRRGTRVPASYLPLRRVLDEGWAYIRSDDPTIDRELEGRLGVDEFAAIELGSGEYLLAFDLASPHDTEQVIFTLGLLRRTIDQQIRSVEMDAVLREARRIQNSIVPHQVPPFGDFEIVGRSQPMEAVGGDFYDCIPLTDKILGLAIADVSGHGLPAALQVRDIYMGLRMGTARDFKIVRTVERLNEIIHHSRGTGRFVSMFYGELEIDGTVIFVNAGHPPPFHLRSNGEIRMLEKGGTVLGPFSGATYTRGYLTMEPGDLLVAYTDGLIESSAGELGTSPEFGLERLIDLARDLRSHTAREILEQMFREVAEFSEESPQSDDRTLAVVKRG